MQTENLTEFSLSDSEILPGLQSYREFSKVTRRRP